MFYLDSRAKRNAKIGVCFICIAIVFMILSLIMGNNNQEQKLTNKLYVLGATYYENVYYKDASAEELEEYNKDGLRVNLRDLIDSIYYKDPNEFINAKTDKKCNYLNSYAIIYPYSPYEKIDYSLSVNLDCGF